jgi:hypothetical protein
MKRKLALLLAITSFSISLPSTTSAIAKSTKCQNIKGSYQRSSDKLVMRVRQTGCQVIGEIPSPGFDHSVDGEWSSRSNGFDVTIVRTNKTNGCVTELTGTLYKKRKNVRLVLDGSDGRCELPTDYKEESVFAAR